MDVCRKPETLEDSGGTGFGGVAVVVLHEFFELTEAIGVKGLVRRRQQSFLFHDRVPQLGITHHGDVQYRLVSVQELILSEDAQPEPLGHGYRASGGLGAATQNLEERGLAGAVGTDQPVAGS